MDNCCCLGWASRNLYCKCDFSQKLRSTTTKKHVNWVLMPVTIENEPISIHLKMTVPNAIVYFLNRNFWLLLKSQITMEYPQWESCKNVYDVEIELAIVIKWVYNPKTKITAWCVTNFKLYDKNFIWRASIEKILWIKKVEKK